MWRAGILVVLAMSVIAEECTYRDLECAPYTVEEQHEDYEVRSYGPLTWVKTVEENGILRIAQYDSFMRLFKYISGQNDRKLKINMTVPVKMRDYADGESTSLEMSFFVPSELAENPPVPDNDKVVISREGATKYAVRTFSGYVWRQATWEEEAQKLAESVKDDASVDKSWYYRVGYDSPMQFLNRRNEIWMVKRPTEADNSV